MKKKKKKQVCFVGFFCTGFSTFQFFIFYFIFFHLLQDAAGGYRPPPQFLGPFSSPQFFFSFIFFILILFFCVELLLAENVNALLNTRALFFYSLVDDPIASSQGDKKSVPPLLLIIISKEEFSNLKLCAVKPFLPDTAERLCRHSPSSSPDSLTWTNSFTSSRCKWCWLLFPQHPRKTFLFFSKGKVRKKKVNDNDRISIGRLFDVVIFLYIFFS